MARDGIVLPPHAYVPGATSRHPENLFDDVKASVRAGMDAGALARSAAWRGGWTCFNVGYFWEAHELFEPVWLALPPNALERQAVQAAIQLANAALKARMDRPRAVARLCDLTQAHLAAARRGGDSVMGLHLDEMAAALDSVRSGGEISPIHLTE